MFLRLMILCTVLKVSVVGAVGWEDLYPVMNLSTGAVLKLKNIKGKWFLNPEKVNCEEWVVEKRDNFSFSLVNKKTKNPLCPFGTQKKNKYIFRLYKQSNTYFLTYAQTIDSSYEEFIGLNVKRTTRSTKVPWWLMWHPTAWVVMIAENKNVIRLIK